MRRYVPWRNKDKPSPEHDYQVAALRLQLVVAMAASDGRIQTVEVERIAQTIDEAKLDADTTDRLDQLMRMLVNAPPNIEQVFERIIEQSPRRQVAEALVLELVHIAAVDDHIDEREEALLRLVCGALKLEPSSLHKGPRRALDASERAQLDELLTAASAA